MPISTRSYLYLSGTPFRAIAAGEFIEEQCFGKTFATYQLAKQMGLKRIYPWVKTLMRRCREWF